MDAIWTNPFAIFSKKLQHQVMIGNQWDAPALVNVKNFATF